MLSALRRFFGRMPASRGVSLDQAVDLIEQKFPSILKRGTYSPPECKCSRWLVIPGPCIGSPSHLGTLLVESKELLIGLRITPRQRGHLPRLSRAPNSSFLNGSMRLMNPTRRSPFPMPICSRYFNLTI